MKKWKKRAKALKVTVKQLEAQLAATDTRAERQLLHQEETIVNLRNEIKNLHALILNVPSEMESLRRAIRSLPATVEDPS